MTSFCGDSTDGSLTLNDSGLDNAGKTTIVKRISGEDITTISPTLGFNIKSLEFKGFLLNIWDIGGQKSLRSYWRNYFEQTDGLIWVIDSTDGRRLKDCADELHTVLLEERLAGASLLIFMNKQDVQGAIRQEEIVRELELSALGNRHWKVVGCSAVTGSGLEQGFGWIVADIASRVYLLE